MFSFISKKVSDIKCCTWDIICDKAFVAFGNAIDDKVIKSQQARYESWQCSDRFRRFK
jgi:hypothetical protein